MNKKYVREVLRGADGRFKKYWEDPSTLKKRVDEYFEILEEDEIASVEGLALWLGMTRSGLLKYQNEHGEEYGRIIRNAKTLIELSWSSTLNSNKSSTAGTIFYLLNNGKGWTNKQEVHHTNATPVKIVDDVPEEK